MKKVKDQGKGSSPQNQNFGNQPMMIITPSYPTVYSREISSTKRKYRTATIKTIFDSNILEVKTFHVIFDAIIILNEVHLLTAALCLRPPVSSRYYILYRTRQACLSLERQRECCWQCFIRSTTCQLLEMGQYSHKFTWRKKVKQNFLISWFHWIFIYFTIFT